jgi:hypothetical protein
MEKGIVKLVVFNGEDFGYWNNRTRNYLLSQSRIIWKIVHEAYVIPATLDNAIQSELTRYENNYKALNLITTALARNVYDSIRLFLKNLMNLLMNTLLGLNLS